MRGEFGVRRTRTSIGVLLVSGIAAGICLRFLFLGRQSLWVDEMLTLMNAYVGREMTASAFFGNHQGPVVSLLMHFWAAISWNEAFLRLPFAVAGAFTVAALFYLARHISDRWASLHMVFVASMSPILIWYSQEVRGYAFAVLFAVLMSYLFVKWLERPIARTMLAYGAALLVGMLSNLSIAFVGMAHFLYLVSAPGRRKLLGRWVVVVFVVLLIFSPWVRQVMLRAHPERVLGAPTGEALLGGSGFSALAIPYTLFTFSVGYSLGPSVREIQAGGREAVMSNLHWVIVAAVIFAIPAVVGIIRMAGERPDVLLLMLLWLVVPLAAISILAARNVKVFTPRYALVSVPAYAIILGQGLAAISRSRYWVLTFVVAAILGLSVHNYFRDSKYFKDDARGVARIVEADIESGDIVVAIYTAEPLMHYLRNVTDVRVFEEGDLKSKAAIDSRCQSLALQGGRVWLSLCREWVVDPQGYVHAWFEQNMERVNNWVVPGMRLYLYERQGEES